MDSQEVHRSARLPSSLGSSKALRYSSSVIFFFLSPHFTDGNTEAQKGKSLSEMVQVINVESWSSGPFVLRKESLHLLQSPETGGCKKINKKGA